jgi:hypothetical protein
MLTPALVLNRILVGILRSRIAGWLTPVLGRPSRWWQWLVELTKAAAKLIGSTPPALARPRRGKPAGIGSARHCAAPAMNRGPELLPTPNPRWPELSIVLNGRERRIPVQIAGPSSLTGWAIAAQTVGAAGGFTTSLSLVSARTAQIRLSGCTDPDAAAERVLGAASELLQTAMLGLPQRWLPVGCIPSFGVRTDGRGGLTALLSIDRLPGHEIEAAARAVAERLVQLVHCRTSPTLQLDVTQTECVTAHCRLEISALERAHDAGTGGKARGGALVQELLKSFGSDCHRPELAALHNLRVLEGITASARGLDLDPIALVSRARAHSARWGSCEPLVRWRRVDQELLGDLQLLVDLPHVVPWTALRHGGMDDVVRRQVAADLINQVVSVGLAASLSYLRAMLANGFLEAARRRLSPEARAFERGSSRLRDNSENDPKAVSQSGVHRVPGTLPVPLPGCEASRLRQHRG